MPPRLPWWVHQRDAPVADPARLRCDAVSMLLDAARAAPQPALERKRPHSFCSQLESARVAFAFRRPSLPSSPSLTSIALPALGTPLDCVWLEGSLGADVQGSDRGIAHHWGPCPADCPVKQRCGPGVQESTPQQRARCVCQPAPSSAAIAPSHTLAHSHRVDSREQRARKWTAWRRARRSWEVSAAYRSMSPLAPELWDRAVQRP
jgi:hypothetical protein